MPRDAAAYDAISRTSAPIRRAFRAFDACRRGTLISLSRDARFSDVAAAEAPPRLLLRQLCSCCAMPDADAAEILRLCCDEIFFCYYEIFSLSPREMMRARSVCAAMLPPPVCCCRSAASADAAMPPLMAISPFACYFTRYFAAAEERFTRCLCHDAAATICHMLRAASASDIAADRDDDDRYDDDAAILRYAGADMIARYSAAFLMSAALSAFYFLFAIVFALLPCHAALLRATLMLLLPRCRGHAAIMRLLSFRLFMPPCHAFFFYLRLRFSMLDAFDILYDADDFELPFSHYCHCFRADFCFLMPLLMLPDATLLPRAYYVLIRCHDYFHCFDYLRC